MTIPGHNNDQHVLETLLAHLDPQRGPDDAPKLDELADDTLHCADRDGEADASRCACRPRS